MHIACCRIRCVRSFTCHSNTRVTAMDGCGRPTMAHRMSHTCNCVAVPSTHSVATRLSSNFHNASAHAKLVKNASDTDWHCCCNVSACASWAVYVNKMTKEIGERMSRLCMRRLPLLVRLMSRRADAIVILGGGQQSHRPMLACCCNQCVVFAAHLQTPVLMDNKAGTPPVDAALLFGDVLAFPLCPVSRAHPSFYDSLLRTQPQRRWQNFDHASVCYSCLCRSACYPHEPHPVRSLILSSAPFFFAAQCPQDDLFANSSLLMFCTQAVFVFAEHDAACCCLPEGVVQLIKRPFCVNAVRCCPTVCACSPVSGQCNRPECNQEGINGK